MFENIGQKIKTFAKVICWLGIVCSCIAGIVILIITEFWDFGIVYLLLSLGVVGVGSVLSWVSSLCVYGFGELIVKVTQIEQNMRDGENKTEVQAKETSIQQNARIEEMVCKARTKVSDKRLKELKELLDEGLITEKDFENALNG